MSDYKTIFKMIEEVSPDDTDKLRLLDEKVWKFIQNVPESLLPDIYICPRYSTSRDALKAIRPEGWQISFIHEYGSGWQSCMESEFSYGDVETHNFFPTEELAELWAIISAINWERENDPS